MLRWFLSSAPSGIRSTDWPPMLIAYRYLCENWSAGISGVVLCVSHLSIMYIYALYLYIYETFWLILHWSLHFAKNRINRVSQWFAWPFGSIFDLSSATVAPLRAITSTIKDWLYGIIPSSYLIITHVMLSSYQHIILSSFSSCARRLRFHCRRVQ